MALIIEVLRAGRGGEVRERLRVGDAPLTIGRALDNILVLDDAHVDAHHARLVRADDGTLRVEDLGSVNRIETLWEGRKDHVIVVHDTVITIGRTTLRFRDELVPVPAAVPLGGAAVGGSEGARWYDRTSGRIGIVAGALALSALNAWLGATERGAASDAFSTILAASAFGLLWAGIWAVAARVVLGQFRLLAHLTVVALAFAAFTALGAVDGWGRFLLPGATFFSALQTGAMVAILAAMVAWHLAASSHLARAQRWRIGAVAGGIVLALIGVSALLEDEGFTARAEFAGVIKPLMPALVPKETTEQFAATMNDLRAEVDAMLKVTQP